jgi:hypothetical protein
MMNPQPPIPVIPPIVEIDIATRIRRHAAPVRG